jgi:hypothetical protein
MIAAPAQPLPPQAAPAPQGQPSPQAPTPAQLPGPIGAVVAGQLPAIRFPAESKTMSSSPLAAYVQSNLDTIARAGADFTELPDKQSVIFNPVKTSKEAIHKAYHAGTLDKIAPEVPAVRAPAQKKPLGTRTVHTAPVGALAQQPPAQPVVNGAGAPAGAPASPDGGGPSGTSPVIPQAPIKQDAKLKGARISALKNESLDGSKLPATTSDRLAKRAI